MNTTTNETKKTAPATITGATKKLNLLTETLTIRGITPLVIHAFDEKSKEQMRLKQQKQERSKKTAKDPDADCERARYRDAEGNECVKAVAIKSAIVRAAKMADMKMIDVRMSVFVRGDLLPIRGPSKMREDVVRVGIDTADLRYRPEYEAWEVEFTVDFNASFVSREELLHLVRLAGFSSGIGEGRPEKSALGWGRFELVEPDKG